MQQTIKENLDICAVNGYLPCLLGDECLGGREVYLAGHHIALTLRHVFDDQYVGVTAEGKDFIRESERNLRPHLVALKEPDPDALTIEIDPTPWLTFDEIDEAFPPNGTPGPQRLRAMFPMGGK